MGSSYWLTRLFYLRGLGFIYFIIGIITIWQGPALIGPDGLTPIAEAVSQFEVSQWWNVFYSYPSLLLINASDAMIVTIGSGILLLSILLVLGYCNIPILLLLWVAQLSLVNGGGRFYSFGWETMMLEMTLLACLFVHPWRLNLMSAKNWSPNYWSFLALLWMMFRLMLGAGMIKIRGDACWLDFTCMDYHYETQPNPHFLSWYYHHLPWWFHRFEIGMTHFYELLVPILFLLTRSFRITGGLLVIFFQFTLISTGNLAFLNWQTIVLALPAFDDRFLRKFCGQRTVEVLNAVKLKPVGTIHSRTIFCAIAVIAFLSYQPMKNLISPQQRMNQSYDGLHLINSYGLFGSITKQRFEVIISGTSDSRISQQTQWQEYQFHCKPGDINRRPCWITPYHLRLDWQMWFSAMRPSLQEQWLANLAKKMLENHPSLETLIDHNPFAGQGGPKFIKMDLYLYHFTKKGDPKGQWWTRSFTKPYMPPVSLRNF